MLALEVELAMLAEQGLDFEREDYVTRFMGLSYQAFHDVIDEEAQKRIGRPISDVIRAELGRPIRFCASSSITS